MDDYSGGYEGVFIGEKLGFSAGLGMRIDFGDSILSSEIRIYHCQEGKPAGLGDKPGGLGRFVSQQCIFSH